MKINLPKYKKDTPKDKFIAEFKSIPIEDCRQLPLPKGRGF